MRGLTKAEVKLLIEDLEKGLKIVEERAADSHYMSHSVALGMAESIIGITIKKLKGEYAI